MKELLKKRLMNIKKYFKFIDKNRQFNTMEVIALMIIAIIFGMFFGGALMYGRGALNIGIKKELKEFASTYTQILNNYFEDIEEDKLLESGIRGMINYLDDPYSIYMNNEESSEFNEKVTGEYVGIGVEILKNQNSEIEVLNVYEDGPAYKAGVKKKDIIIKIDNKEIKDKSTSDVSKLVRGKVGTNVKITVLRDSKEVEINVKRGNIDINSIYSEVIEYDDSKVGYILIDIFAANTNLQFKSKLEELENKNIDSLIIDVRGNSGGYLSSVTDIISLFLKKGDLIYELKTKNKTERIYDKTKDSRKYKIAILVNGGSASASEILTAALMENYKAYTIGSKTYGKSKVQKTQDLSNGSTIKYTFQEWLTPSGKNIGDEGITPEYEVSYQPSDTENKYDSQMQKALDLLTGKDE